MLQMISSFCPRFDSLRIYDGATEGDRYLANLCGRIKNRFRLQSSGTHLLLKFRSDMINTRPGFRAAVDFTWGESGLNLMLSSLLIYLSVISDVQCFWECYLRRRKLWPSNMIKMRRWRRKYIYLRGYSRFLIPNSQHKKTSSIVVLNMYFPQSTSVVESMLRVDKVVQSPSNQKTHLSACGLWQLQKAAVFSSTSSDSSFTVAAGPGPVP